MGVELSFELCDREARRVEGTLETRPLAGEVDGEPLVKPARAVWIEVVEGGVNQLVAESRFEQTTPCQKRGWLKVDPPRLTGPTRPKGSGGVSALTSRGDERGGCRVKVNLDWRSGLVIDPGIKVATCPQKGSPDSREPRRLEAGRDQPAKISITTQPFSR